MAYLIHTGGVRVELTDKGLFSVAVLPSALEEATLEEVLDQINPHLEANAPVLYLLDGSTFPDLSLAERWGLAKRAQRNRALIKKSAIYAMPTRLRFALDVVIRVSGRDNLRAFPDRASAEAWLLQD